MTDTIHVDFCVTPRPGVWDVEGRVEVIIHSHGAEQTRDDPGYGPEWELGAIEVIIGHTRTEGGSLAYTYDPLNLADPYDRETDVRVRQMLGEPDFADTIADAIACEKHGAIYDAMKRRWEERREDQAIEGEHA